MSGQKLSILMVKNPQDGLLSLLFPSWQVVLSQMTPVKFAAARVLPGFNVALVRFELVRSALVRFLLARSFFDLSGYQAGRHP